MTDIIIGIVGALAIALIAALWFWRTLDAAERRGRAAGLREAQGLARDCLSEGYQVIHLHGAISARLTALSADTPANRGEG